MIKVKQKYHLIINVMITSRYRNVHIRSAIKINRESLDYKIVSYLLLCNNSETRHLELYVLKIHRLLTSEKNFEYINKINAQIF